MFSFLAFVFLPIKNAKLSPLSHWSIYTPFHQSDQPRLRGPLASKLNWGHQKPALNEGSFSNKSHFFRTHFF